LNKILFFRFKENSNKIKSLKLKIEKFRNIIQSPEMHLHEYFSEMKFKIDILFDPLIVECQSETKKNKLTDNWLEIIDRIKLFEYECMTCHSMNRFEFNIEQFDALETKLNEFLILVESKLVEYQDENKLSDLPLQRQGNEVVFNFTKQIDKIQFDLDKSLFLNKTIVFLERDANLDKEVFFIKMDSTETAGKLLIISNIFFSTNEINEAFR
jgi:hypothetical protein